MNEGYDTLARLGISGDERVEIFMPERMAGELSVAVPRQISAFVRRRRLPEGGPKPGRDSCATRLDWPVVATVLALLPPSGPTTTTSWTPASPRG